MSFIGSKNGKIYAPGLFLAHEECVRETRQIASSGTTTGTQGVYTFTLSGTYATDDVLTIDGVSFTVTATEDTNTKVAAAFVTAYGNATGKSYTVTSSSEVITFTEASGKYGAGLPASSVTSTAGKVTAATTTAGVAKNYEHFTEDGAIYVKGGTPYPSNDANAIGIIYEDVDVTTGDMPGSVVTKGVVYEDRLAVTLDSDAKTALAGLGFKFV